MSNTESDTLAEAIRDAYATRSMYTTYGQAADAILLSEWLEDHDRRIAAQALQEFAAFCSRYAAVCETPEARWYGNAYAQMAADQAASIDAAGEQ